MVNEIKFHEFEKTQDLDIALSDTIAQQLQDAINRKGFASLIVSGGRTPLSLFECLSLKDIEWDKVWVSLADERWVEPSHSDSNSTLVLQHLRQNKAKGLQFFEFYQKGEQQEVLANLEQRIPQKKIPFDAVILGMGLDGHTASWFPCSDDLENVLSSSNCLEWVQPKSAPHLRMTFTPKALLNSKQIYLHLVGDKKREVYECALKSDRNMEMPIRVALHQNVVPVDVYWSV